MKDIIDKLILLNKTISTMESCTGGHIVDEITNVEHASSIISFSAITYSIESKVKMGVAKELIDKFGVYSIEVAKEMSKVITFFSNSDYGIGITGQLKNKESIVYISIYDKEKDLYTAFSINPSGNTRKENKDIIKESIKKKLLEIL